MGKQKIKAKIEKYKAKIEKLELELRKPEVNRFEFEKPREGEVHCFMTHGGQSYQVWYNTLSDNERWELGNCFSNAELCEKGIEKQKAVMQLKRIAHRLNNGEVIDWKDDDQAKWLIYYNHDIKVFGSDYNCFAQKTDLVCLDSNFCLTALSEMGGGKLKLALGVE